KRKYGNFILSKSFESQKKELIFRLIAYNVDRKLILSVWVLGFHQSPIIKISNDPRLIKQLSVS
ncbi:MAG: hypothetical protein V1888_02465, partial [archaeon]